MLWNKKEEKAERASLPDLPEISYKSEKNMLPSFPDSLGRKGFSQSAIKEAVEDGSYSEENELPELPELPEAPEAPKSPERESQESKSSKLPEWQPSISHSYSNQPEDLSEERIKSEEVPEKHMFSEMRISNVKNADIFVKIDKFHTAKKTLSSVKFKVEEIESLLKKIRETKLKEERELSFWENELMGVKAKIKDVSENIFEKA